MPFTFRAERLSSLSEYEGVMAIGALTSATAGAAKKVQPHVMLTNEPSGFPRSARLLRHADFERVYKEGKRHFSATITVFYLARREGENLSTPRKRAGVPAPRELRLGLRVGFTVGRVLGGAVQRNRMKRRLREAVRLTRPATAVAADVVINPKKTLLAADFKDVTREVKRAFEVIQQNLSQNHARKQSRGDGV
ncbi:MAG TPA: ribonuclease P protein component [Candidatus Sulfotelmatobacter sp.]